MVPDEIFDQLLVELTGAELKVLLYIVRRTFGFKRESDTISLSQMLNGIATRDGRVLDRGVGLSKKTLLDALRSLAARRIILTQRRQSLEKGNEPTAYRLNVIRQAQDAQASGEARDGAPHEAPPAARGGIETGTKGAPKDGQRPATPLGGISTPPLGKKVHQGVGHESTPSPRGKNSPTQDSVQQHRVGQKTGAHHPLAAAAGGAGRPQPSQLPQSPQSPQSPHSPQSPQPAQASQRTLAPPPPTGHRSTAAVDVDDVVDFLISCGVTRRIAVDLAAKHAGEAIRQQAAWQSYRPAVKSPAGALVQAIRDAWPPPPAWIEAREHEASVARQAEAERQRQAEDEARRQEWAAKPPEERIAGRLQFWLLSQRRKGREPSAAEVAGRRAELLSELAATAGAELPAGLSSGSATSATMEST
jgi:hypothetical protein